MRLHINPHNPNAVEISAKIGDKIGSEIIATSSAKKQAEGLVLAACELLKISGEWQKERDLMEALKKWS
jgi:hypothetical protein